VTDPLRQASTDDPFGELRRRKPEIDDLVLRQQLGLDRHHRDAAASLRTLALIALTVMSLVLIAFIVWLTMDGTDVPDLVSGLTGSAIGAILGSCPVEQTQEAVSGCPEWDSDCRPSLRVRDSELRLSN